MYPTKIFVDPILYPLDQNISPYFLEKGLSWNEAGFDLRVCSIEDEYGRGIVSEKDMSQGFRSIQGDTLEQPYFRIEPLRPYLYNSGIKMELPEGWYGDIALRSSCFKFVAMPSNGVVDFTYRGFLKVAFFSYSPLYIQQYTRVAQIKMIRYNKEYIFVQKEEELSKTDRGEKGFGEHTNKVTP